MTQEPIRAPPPQEAPKPTPPEPVRPTQSVDTPGPKEEPVQDRPEPLTTGHPITEEPEPISPESKQPETEETPLAAPEVKVQPATAEPTPMPTPAIPQPDTSAPSTTSSSRNASVDSLARASIPPPSNQAQPSQPPQQQQHSQVQPQPQSQSLPPVEGFPETPFHDNPWTERDDTDYFGPQDSYSQHAPTHVSLPSTSDLGETEEPTSTLTTPRATESQQPQYPSVQQVAAPRRVPGSVPTRTRSSTVSSQTQGNPQRPPGLGSDSANASRSSLAPSEGRGRKADQARQVVVVETRGNDNKPGRPQRRLVIIISKNVCTCTDALSC